MAISAMKRWVPVANGNISSDCYKTSLLTLSRLLASNSLNTAESIFVLARLRYSASVVIVIGIPYLAIHREYSKYLGVA